MHRRHHTPVMYGRTMLTTTMTRTSSSRRPGLWRPQRSPKRTRATDCVTRRAFDVDAHTPLEMQREGKPGALGEDEKSLGCFSTLRRGLQKGKRFGEKTHCANCRGRRGAIHNKGQPTPHTRPPRPHIASRVRADVCAQVQNKKFIEVFLVPLEFTFLIRNSKNTRSGSCFCT